MVNQNIARLAEQGRRLRKVERTYLRFASGVETMQDLLRADASRYDALLHGEIGLSHEEIDRLVEFGVSLEWLCGAGDPEKILYYERTQEGL